MIRITAIGCGVVESVQVLGRIPAEVAAGIAMFDGAEFGPVTLRVTGCFGAAGIAPAGTAEMVAFLLA